MKDFRLAIVAVICADTPKSAMRKERKTWRKWRENGIVYSNMERNFQSLTSQKYEILANITLEFLTLTDQYLNIIKQSVQTHINSPYSWLKSFDNKDQSQIILMKKL